MDIDNIKQIAMFFQKVGQEIWEQGELSPDNKAILPNTPAQQELLDAAINCSQAFSNDFDHFAKDCLDILCNNKGNAIINKLLARFSQYINNYVAVEDTSEIDDATYQQMRSNFEQIIHYVKEQLRNRGFTKMDEEKEKEILRNFSVEDIRAAREVLRKFAIKAIDTETEIYNQIPVA
ncbi:22154_t:CDS:2 [Entrophospora sp. SA101]|nr:22154_t:CDS:2 [Entrophospora sp. SA101]CAJ0831351.1 22567_t:CDS:2 [Entrophospora sp. SA101]